jgi:hypothetical protein
VSAHARQLLRLRLYYRNLLFANAAGIYLITPA